MQVDLVQVDLYNGHKTVVVVLSQCVVPTAETL